MLSKLLFMALIVVCSSHAYVSAHGSTIRPPGRYVPGEPGADWSEHEVEVMRQKVLKMLTEYGNKLGDQEDNTKSGGGLGKKFNQNVDEMGLFRLAFHDCVGYTDGTGGCDGCLNWTNMGRDPVSPFHRNKDRYCANQFPRERFDRTDNNGFAHLAKHLEGLYKSTNFPKDAPPLNVSLYDSGKSRADLWQFAVNVALEKTIEQSNTACRYDNKQAHQIPLLENDGKGLAYGIWKCKIKLEKPFKFRTGRRDCIPDPAQPYPYITTKEENHFNPHSNGPELLRKLMRTMGMSAEDFIATAFPVHNMIGNNVFNGFSIGTKYEYLKGGEYLSNMFFKFLANRPTYTNYIGRGVDKPDFALSAIGDTEGKPVATWAFRMSCQKCMNTSQAWAGGPCHWRPTVQQDGEAPNQEKIVTSCYNGMDESGNYKNATKEGCENAYFTKEGVEVGGRNHKRPTGRKYAQWTNQFLLNWEVGMTHKFDVDPETFRATNCTGLEVAEDGSGFVDGICQINSVCTSKRAFCPVQDYVEPSKGKPVNRIVEDFADDHDLWARSFLEGWQRFTETGYTDLKDGPQNSWMGFYKLKEMGVDIGGDYSTFISQNSPMVFSKEDVGQSCRVRTLDEKTGPRTFKDLYDEKGVDPEFFGPSCSTFEDCNDPTFGEK